MASLYADIVNGNDTTGNGSFANPWATLQKLLDSAVASTDDCYLRAGTYILTASYLKNSPYPRSLQSYNSENVKITCNTPSAGYQLRINASAGNRFYFQDITFENLGSGTASTTCGVTAVSGSVLYNRCNFIQTSANTQLNNAFVFFNSSEFGCFKNCNFINNKSIGRTTNLVGNSNIENLVAIGCFLDNGVS